MNKEQRDELRDRIAKQGKGEYMVGLDLIWLLDAADEAERLREENARLAHQADAATSCLNGLQHQLHFRMDRT